ncbi:MAG: peptidoglycan-binding domain-containing protein [Evtepia gabavorous]
MSTSLPPAFSLGPVSTLQEMLRTIAFVNRSLPFLRPTGRFDEETLEAVMMFQKINGFPVTGIVDRRAGRYMNAFAGLQSSAPPTVTIFSQGAELIHPGQSSPLLRPLQDMFRALAEILEGIASTPSTGVLDEDTTANLRWLQGHSGLPQTGVLDQNTWEMLVRLFETFVSQKPVQKIDNNQKTHL